MFLDKEQPSQGCNRVNLTAGGSTNQFAALAGEERNTLQQLKHPYRSFCSSSLSTQINLQGKFNTTSRPHHVKNSNRNPGSTTGGNQRRTPGVVPVCSPSGEQHPCLSEKNSCLRTEVLPL